MLMPSELMSPRLDMLRDDPGPAAEREERTNRPLLSLCRLFVCWRGAGLELEAYLMGDDSSSCQHPSLEGIEAYAPPMRPLALALGVRSPSPVVWVLVICRRGDETSRSRFARAIAAGEER